MKKKRSDDARHIEGWQSKNERIESLLNVLYDFRFNTVKSRTEYRAADSSDLYQPVTKFVLNSFRRRLDATAGIVTSAENIRTILESDFARKVHPIQEYFNALPLLNPAEHGHIDRLLNTVQVANPGKWEEYFTKWLIGVVANAMNDTGCQNHTCLVLTGDKQGQFKSWWLDNLCPPLLKNYLFTGKIDPQGKDILTLIAEYLFINIDDQLKELNKQNENALKNLITTPAVKYRRPLREDNTPSFKVDYNANLWCDYGTGEGGTLIDLVMKQNGCNAYGAICRLEQGNTASFSFHGKDLPERDTKRQAASPIEIRRIQPLQNPALMRYLQERGISPGTAAPYVQEMYYRIGGKPYFALAFKNDSGGYELRNPRFKGSTSKDITHIRQQGEPREKCLVFEGFMDYLSFLTLRMKNCPTMPDLDRQDYVILNSTANVPKAIDVLFPYKRIHCMLDNDEAGFRATQAIALEYSYRVRDFSDNYRGYSDLNDYLCGRKQEQKNSTSQAQEIKRETGQRATPKQKRGRGI